MHLYELKNISHSYGDRTVLSINHWHIPADTVTGVVGPNGSGKSTLLSLLGFVAKPTQGEIRFNGHPSLPFEERVRGNVALLTQASFLLKRSVYSNVAYGLKVDREKKQERRRIFEALEMVGLEPDKFADRPWYALSGGEARRVALAARMVLQPEVLLMDEPTISVDAASAQMIKEAALHARQQWGTTLVITSHDSEWLADFSEHILHLFRGRILGNGKQTLIFGPWKENGHGVLLKTLTEDQKFEAHGTPADEKIAVATIEAKQMDLYAVSTTIPSQRHCLKGLLTRLSYEQSIGRTSAAVLVGEVVFNVYLKKSQEASGQFNPGQSVWVAYDPGAVEWY
jgi:tungstate transport system ATP-binding protein